MTRPSPAVVVAALAAACAAPAPPRGLANTAATAEPARDPASPIPREEIARKVVPETAELARAAIAGTWEGRRYAYDSERGFAGVPGDSDVFRLELGANGEYLRRGACDHGGVYQIDHEHGDLAITLDRRWTCRGPDPYAYPSYIHRLDEDFLVLIDGMTAGVSAFRRVK
jgi:hypothetical protein